MADFSLQIQKLSERIESLKDKVVTEEATKTSFIMPFLNILGYDVFDPTIVVPEFTADIGRKKGEKVDYAIMHNDKPLILIEAKPHTEPLDRHKTQLERYFTVTDCKFGILTNGIEYRFYSDLEKPNVMDKKPFLTINLLKLKDRDIKELEKFKYENLDIDNILSLAGTKKYINGIKDIFRENLKNPSDDFVKLFASQLINKPLRHSVIEEFREYTKRALNEVIMDLVSEKITNLTTKLNEENEENFEEENNNGIVTTEEELNGFYIIKSILAENFDVNRIDYRDTKSYFGILVDNNKLKWIIRLHFNTSKKYLEIRTGEKESEKILLENLNEIFKYKDKIIAAAKMFE